MSSFTSSPSRGAEPKILLGSGIFSWQKIGGISRYFVELAEGLSRTPGIRIVQSTGAHSNQHLRDLGTPNVSRIGFPHWNHNLKGSQKFSKLIDGSLLKFGDFDLYHASAYGPWPAFSQSKPIVTTIYDCVHEEIPETDPDGTLKLAKTTALKESKLLLCISDTTRRALVRHHNISEDRCVVTYLGVSVPNFLGSDPLGEPYLLHVGDRQGYKDSPTLYKAFSEVAAHHSTLRLLLVGGGPLREHESGLLESLGIRHRISLLSMDDKELHGAYCHAKAVVIPSRYEGFGLPAVEAMARGIPLIHSDGGSLPEVAGDAGLMFEAGDASSLSEAIRQVLEDHSLTHHMREQGLVRARDFTWSKCVEQTHRAYLRALNLE